MNSGYQGLRSEGDPVLTHAGYRLILAASLSNDFKIDEIG